MAIDDHVDAAATLRQRVGAPDVGRPVLAKVCQQHNVIGARRACLIHGVLHCGKRAPVSSSQKPVHARMVVILRQNDFGDDAVSVALAW